MRCVQWMAPSTMAMAMAVLTSLTSLHAVAAGVAVDEIALPLERVAFGSCNQQSRPQPLWSAVQATDPQLWLWMGDAIYGDYKAFNELKTYLPPFRVFRDAPPEMLQEKYSLQLTDPGYASLAQQVPVIGTWDDHDYGINDGDKMYPYRTQSQQLFLDFLGEPAASPRRTQDGVYTSHTIGSGQQTVKFILLDVRFHKDPYGTDDGDFLGPAQWQWLENELSSSSAAFNIIVSGIQILPQDRFYGGENWYRFPAQRQRLINLILMANVKGVILLSGDVHYAEINQIQCEDHTALLTEITSSGMTHSWDKPSLDSVGALLFRAANLILPWDFRPHRNAYYGYKNFGEIVFDWEAMPLPTATVRVRGENSDVKLEHTFSSHFAEHVLPNPSSLCHAIQPSSPPATLVRRVVLMAFVGAIVGSMVSLTVASAWLLLIVYRRSFAFMADLQRRWFDHGYEKLE